MMTITLPDWVIVLLAVLSIGWFGLAVIGFLFVREVCSWALKK